MELILVFMLIAAIFYIATSSLAIQCYNDAKVTGNSFNFLISNLVTAILTVIIAFIGLYLSMKNQ
jgi:uncharacterized BrkB/YihY/UPF0761 family membrane protein